jgi:hypothetical protein
VSEPPRPEKAASPAAPPERQGLQRLDLKLFAALAAASDMDDVSDRVLAVFGRWRLEEGEEIVDLADYAHVPDGPGVILISHRWQFGIDWAGGAPGFFYSSRKGLSGTFTARLAQALRGLLARSERLVREPEMEGALRARAGELDIVVNDRLHFPNGDAADREVRPAVDAVVRALYGGAPGEVNRESDPGRRLGYRVRVQVPDDPPLAELARRLEGL